MKMILATGVLALACASAMGGPATFRVVDTPWSDASSRGVAVSGDGSAVLVAGPVGRPGLWRFADRATWVQITPGGWSLASISHNGEVVYVSEGAQASSTCLPWSVSLRWANGILSPLGSGTTLGNSRTAYACNADGSVAVGRVCNYTRAFDSNFTAGAVWRDAGAPVRFDAPLMAVNANGGYAAGDGFRIDLGRGAIVPNFVHAKDMTPDGRTIVGQTMDPQFPWRDDPAIWREGGQTSGETNHLDRMAWAEWARVSAISDDARRIVGTQGLLPMGNQSYAAIWHDGVPQYLGQRLLDEGAALPPGARLITAEDISGDGRVIVGAFVIDGDYADPRAYIATLGTPCDADVDSGRGWGEADGAVGIEDLVYFLGAFERGDLSADIADGRDGAVSIDDLVHFLIRFEGGC